MCAHNEEANILEAICCICQQIYAGNIRLLVVDNFSTDRTKQRIETAKACGTQKCSVEYVYCKKLGKQNALNHALEMVNTKYFITVDADTYLERHAVQHIMNHIVQEKSACVAGNLFVKNAKSTLVAKMQNYDYLLSIAAIKRFQGSYRSTLVAQGAFSAYKTKEVQALGGWKNCLGEDIVLTYQILNQGKASTYEPKAVGYTTVPNTLEALYNQRKRWAIGMLEGFAHVKPWEQGTGYSKYFTSVNISIIYLDLAFLFGFIPGLVFALFGYYYFIGCLTLFALLISGILYLSMYLYQQKLNIPFQNSFMGFVCFLLFFQLIQSTAALHGYAICLFNRKGEWE
jgi:biofilm PGA synthesis N-glycosyltransferase PgaC